MKSGGRTSLHNVSDFFKDNYEELVRRVSKYTMNRDDAEDIVMTVFERLLSSAFQEITNLERFMNRCVTNAIIDHYRKNSEAWICPNSDVEYLCTECGDISSVIIDQESVKKILNFINELDNKLHSCILIDYFFNDCGLEEICQRYDVTKDNVYKIIRRFRKGL